MHPQSTTPKRFAIFARVSTEDQADYGTGLDEQEHKCRQLVDLKDGTVAPEHVYSGDESGRLPLDRRPLVQRLLAGTRARSFDAVVFHKLDRMARQLKYMLQLWDELEAAGVHVLIVDPTVDTSTPVGRLIRSVLGAIAEFEVDTILERTAAGRKRKIERGEIWLPRRKYGYVYTPVDRAARVPGRITRNEAAVPVIRRMYERRAAGMSAHRIAMELTADGVSSPEGTGPWWPSTIQGILADPAYKGQGRWGLTEVDRVADGKRVVRPRGDRKGILSVPYPAIVSPEMWQAANDAAARPGRRVVRTTPDKFLLYGGMLRCAEHGLVMGGTGSTTPTPRYQCKRRTADSRYTCHQVPSRILDEDVWETLMLVFGRQERMQAAIREQIDALEAGRAQAGQRKRETARELAELEEQLSYLLRVGRETKIAPMLLERQMAEVSARESDLRRELQMLTAQEQVAELEIDEEQRVAALMKELHKQTRSYTPQQRRDLLEFLHIQVTVQGNKFTVHGALDRQGISSYIGLPSQQRVVDIPPATMQTEQTPRCSPCMHPVPFRLSGTIAAR